MISSFWRSSSKDRFMVSPPKLVDHVPVIGTYHFYYFKNCQHKIMTFVKIQKGIKKGFHLYLLSFYLCWNCNVPSSLSTSTKNLRYQTFNISNFNQKLFLNPSFQSFKKFSSWWIKKELLLNFQVATNPSIFQRKFRLVVLSLLQNQRLRKLKKGSGNLR